MSEKDVLRKTGEAARYLVEKHGLPISAHTLRKWRRRDDDDPRGRGPDWKVDPVTDHAMYEQSKLDLFAEQWRSRLVTTRIEQPAQLASCKNRKGTDQQPPSPRRE